MTATERLARLAVYAFTALLGYAVIFPESARAALLTLTGCITC